MTNFLLTDVGFANNKAHYDHFSNIIWELSLPYSFDVFAE